MKYVGNKVSYIRHPFARNSYWGLGLGAVSLGLTAVSMALSVRNGGQGGLITGALGFSGIAAALMGFWFSYLSFREKEKNYMLARVSIGICLVTAVFWLMIIIVGLR